MRPPDENQAASTRPNLMSSRRAAGEENILAMLERDAARRSGGRLSGMRLASYGAAAALAGILAGGVAWLAYDNPKPAQEMHAGREATPAAAPKVLADSALPPPPRPSPGPAPIVEAPRAAVIVDEAARRPQLAAAAVPPLVMLPPGEAAGAKPAPPAARPVQEPPRPKVAKAEPPAARAVTTKKADKKAEKSPQPAIRSTKPALARAPAAAKTRADTAARTRKTVAKPTSAPVDSDVALISAIISQSERHRGEREAQGCNAACPPAKPAQR